jgi:pyruvate/2-oxoglutarate dehydrogenase complex dihydrolipoamide dehydrogenase (E3) component
MGGQQVGLETAIWLADAGRATTLIEPTGTIAGDVNEFLRAHLLRLAGGGGVRIVTGATVTAITPEGVQLSGIQQDYIQADSVVSALGSTAYDPLSEQLKRVLPEVYVIGSAVAPGRLHEATRTALEVASAL